MIIQRITVQNFGAIALFDCELESGLNIIKSRHIDALSHAIQLLLNHKTSLLPLPGARGNTKIEALIRIANKPFRVVASGAEEQDKLCLHAYDACGADATREFFYFTSHCIEHDMATVFQGDSPPPFRLLQYLEEDRHYVPRELGMRTDRISETQAFRSYLKRFIKDFTPETICEGKQYRLILHPNGRYGVQHISQEGIAVSLSESEQILFRYLCFLRTAEFWRGFEELRNLHSVKKPLLVSHFLERLDESIDVRHLWKRTAHLKRQLIILCI